MQNAKVKNGCVKGFGKNTHFDFWFFNFDLFIILYRLLYVLQSVHL